MTSYNYLPSTIEAAQSIPAGCVSRQSHDIGMAHCEPLIVILDSLHRYALAHENRYESKLAEDYVLGAYWLQSLCGARDLLNGNGAVALERDRSTDSKDNGACERMFWLAMESAGFKESDVV